MTYKELLKKVKGNFLIIDEKTLNDSNIDDINKILDEKKAKAVQVIGNVLEVNDDKITPFVKDKRVQFFNKTNKFPENKKYLVDIKKEVEDFTNNIKSWEAQQTAQGNTVTDEEKIKEVYKRLAMSQIVYDDDANAKYVNKSLDLSSMDEDELQTISDTQNLSGIVTKKSVCRGYSSALTEVLYKLGYKAKTIEGKAINSQGQEERHAWVSVIVDGKNKFLDLTWDQQIILNNPNDPDMQNFLIDLDDAKLQLQQTDPNYAKSQKAKEFEKTHTPQKFKSAKDSVRDLNTNRNKYMYSLMGLGVDKDTSTQTQTQTQTQQTASEKIADFFSKVGSFIMGIIVALFANLFTLAPRLIAGSKGPKLNEAKKELTDEAKEQAASILKDQVGPLTKEEEKAFDLQLKQMAEKEVNTQVNNSQEFNKEKEVEEEER